MATLRIPCESQEGVLCDGAFLASPAILDKYDVKHSRRALSIPFSQRHEFAVRLLHFKASCPPSRRTGRTEDSGVAYSLLHSQVSLSRLLFTSVFVPFRPICCSNHGSASISALAQKFRETCHRVQVASAFLVLVGWSERVL